MSLSIPSSMAGGQLGSATSTTTSATMSSSYLSNRASTISYVCGMWSPRQKFGSVISYQSSNSSYYPSNVTSGTGLNGPAWFATKTNNYNGIDIDAVNVGKYGTVSFFFRPRRLYGSSASNHANIIAWNHGSYSSSTWSNLKRASLELASDGSIYLYSDYAGSTCIFDNSTGEGYSSKRLRS